MLKPVWNATNVVNKQVTILEEYEGITLYTINSEERSLAVEVNSALLRIGFVDTSLKQVKAFIDNDSDFYQACLDHVTNNLSNYAKGDSWLNLQYANVVGMKEKALEARQQREEFREAQRIAKEEKEALEAAESIKMQELELDKAQQEFITGEIISANLLQGLLERHNLWNNVPIRTKGWIMNKLVVISHKHGYKAYSKGDSVFKWVNALKSMLEVHNED